MALVKCSVCGIEREDDGKLSCCPLCGGAFAPVEKPVVTVEEEIEEIFDPELLRGQLYEISLPALNDASQTDSVIKHIKSFLQQRTKAYPQATFDVLWQVFDKYRRQIEKEMAASQRARAMMLVSAAREYKAAIDKPTPGLGFSLITNNTIDAAAYVGLAAFDEKKHRLKQETAAIQKFTKELRALAPSADNEFYPILCRGIERIVYYFTILHDAYNFVNEHRAFYQNPDQNDLGVSIEGVNIYQLIAKTVNNSYKSSGFIARHSEQYSAEADWTLRMLDTAGYIKYIYAPNVTSSRLYSAKEYYYVTTGKYERAILQNRYWAAHPEEKAAHDKAVQENNAAKYAQAEALLKDAKFYEAAVSFAKLDGYQDAVQRSIRIWQEKILPVQSWLKDNSKIGSLHGYAVTSNGTILYTRKNKFYLEKLQKHKVKQLVKLQVDRTISFVALDLKGRLVTNLTPRAEEVLNAAMWKRQNIVSIYARPPFYGDYIVFLYKDGTVAFWGKLDGKEVDLSHWRNISKLFCFEKAIIGLKTDGTIITVGETAAYENTYSRWNNVIDVKLEGHMIVALTSDGRAFAEGPEPEKYDLVSEWNNIAKIDFVRYLPLGLTHDGFLRLGSSVDKSFGELFGQKGVISSKDSYRKLDHILKMDGTVYQYHSNDNWDDYSECKDIVGMFSDGNCAIQADGKITFAKTCPEEIREAYQDWRLFEHIDTFYEEQQRAIDNANIAGDDDGSSEKTKSGGCYIATAVYGSYDCPQVWTLRRFRDLTLNSSWYGRAFIRTYYAISPTLVKWFGETKWFKNLWKPMLDRMVQTLNSNGVENTPYDDLKW